MVGWELLKNIFPGRPAVGSPILLNGVRFEIIGVLSKVGQDGNNGTNARIFIPIETMRNLFRLKEQNSEDAISFLNYRPLTPSGNLAAKREVHDIIAAATGSIPSSHRIVRRLGHHRRQQARGQILTAWTIFSAWSA